MECHGGGNDGEMMSSGNEGGGLFCVEYSCFATVWFFCVGFGRMWQLVSVCVSFLFALSCVKDRR